MFTTATSLATKNPSIEWQALTEFQKTKKIIGTDKTWAWKLSQQLSANNAKKCKNNSKKLKCVNDVCKNQTDVNN